MANILTGISRIEVPTPYWPSRAWTLDNTTPGTKVKLGIFELPRPGQLWNFIRVDE
ncbi:hypothetical protein OG21DRAFT_1488217 [Imleria badia]|nr:hypothetical protein OG21DRAFT_1488217 [Imleria badia]